MFDTGKTRTFEREVYACGSVLVRPRSEVRAVYAMGSASLGEGSTVDRWIDAEAVLSVYDDCDLGISASSASHLVIGRNCRFRRLYAPVIDVGTYYEEIEEPPKFSRVPFVSREVLWGKRSLDEDDRDEELDRDDADDDGVVVGTVVTSHSLKVLEDIVVAGDIRSHNSVRLCDRSVVFGNIFAEDGIVIGEGCRVYGTVFCQGDISIGDGTVVGTEGQLRSIVARGSITFEGRARVHGYVSTEGDGLVVPDEETGDSPSDRKEREVVVWPVEAVDDVVARPDLESIELGLSAYRKDERVIAAYIPSGAAMVPRSMFYRCKRLFVLELPGTIERIDDFAFFGCERLRCLDLRSCGRLREIGASAFEGCTGLVQVMLPGGLEKIEEAAFRDCTALERMDMGGLEALESIGSHAFQGCASLSAVTLPGHVSGIGMSAFYGCASLESLSIPDSVGELGGYFAAECSSLERLSVPRALSDAEAAGLPDGVALLVRSGQTSDEGAQSFHGERASASAAEGAPPRLDSEMRGIDGEGGAF